MEQQENRGRRVTLRDVAERAELAISSVSMALADDPGIGAETKARVRALCRQMGYKGVAIRRAGENGRGGRKLARVGIVIVEHGRSQTQAMVISALSRATDARIEATAIDHALGHDAALRRAVEFASGLDGLLLFDYIEPALTEGLRLAGVPAVACGHVMAQPGNDRPLAGHVVRFDAAAMGRLATGTLIKMGHRRIAFLCESLPPGLWNDLWLEGYRLAHLEAGVPISRELVRAAPLREEPARHAIAALLRHRNPPTAYVLPGLSLVFMQGLRDLGLDIRQHPAALGALEHVMREVQMESHFCLTGNLDLQLAVAVRLLRDLRAEPLPCPTETILPFRAHNLPRGRKIDALD